MLRSMLLYSPVLDCVVLTLQANRDLMEHSIKLGDCLGKGAFGSVYRVRSDPFCQT
jgi:hypothetical protein